MFLILRKYKILSIYLGGKSYMKNKKIVLIFIVLLCFVLIGGFFAIKYFKDKQESDQIQEYTPQEEITEEQYRQTIVSLYFENTETKELMPEARMMDIKELIDNPYEKLINMLMEKPKNEKLNKLIPENTKILNINKEGDTLIIDFSSEFLNYDKSSDSGKSNLIYSIVNTMTELTEINHVRFLIDGTENSEFSDVYVRR